MRMLKSLTVLFVAIMFASILEAQTISTKKTVCADLEIRERLEGSEIVISGKVFDISSEIDVTPVSQHYADWRQAIIEIYEVLKDHPRSSRITTITGNKTKTTQFTTLWFQASKDVAWFEYPKFERGQEGIWILRYYGESPAYTAPDPCDFQNLENLDMVRRLLK